MFSSQVARGKGSPSPINIFTFLTGVESLCDSLVSCPKAQHEINS